MKRFLTRLFAVLCAGALLMTSVSALSVEQALSLLEEHYVYELPDAAYDAATLDELMDYVADPYTYYMDAQEYAAFTDSVESDKTVCGIGAGIRYTDEGILILSVLPGGGAEDAGLVPGDVIVAIEGAACVPADETHRELLLGEENTLISVTVLHSDGETDERSIERRSVTVSNTVFSLEDGVGMIDCNSFGTQTGRYFSEGITQYNDRARIWLTDLRENGGGLAAAAVSASGAFVGEGTLLYFKDRSGSRSAGAYYWDALTDKPVIILTNARTASASEIFTSNVLSAGAGISVGSRTYGKGVAQLVFNADNSAYFDGDAFKITAYRFYCSNGSTTDRIGVIPTVCVADYAAREVAMLLCAQKPAQGEYLHLILNGLDFYVALETAKSEHADALRSLFSALAPDAAVFYGRNGNEQAVSVAQACALCGCEAPVGFSDVSASAYADEIDALGVYRLVLGDGDNAFHPSTAMTRAEVCALLSQALNVGTSASGFFADVPDGAWYASSVNAMAALGLVNGVGDGRFSPYGTMTQEEFIAVMGRLAAFLSRSVSNYLTLLSNSGETLDALYPRFSSWACAGADVLTALIRTEDGSYANMLFAALDEIVPKSPILREQAAASMYNTLRTLGYLSY